MSDTNRAPRYIATLWGQNGPEVVGYSDDGDTLEGFREKLNAAFTAERAIPTYVIWERHHRPIEGRALGKDSGK